jgi:hypothetical protein
MSLLFITAGLCLLLFFSALSTLSTLTGDYTHRDGTFTFSDGVTLPADSVGDRQVDASSPIAANKLGRRMSRTYAQANGASIASATQRIHRAYGATGSIVAVRCEVTGVVGSGGGMSVTVDLKKNGASVLTAVMTIDATTVLDTPVDGSVSADTFASGDYLELVVTATAGGGTLPQGLFVDLIIDEDPS